jgi:anaphase-promoting complex subunit 1
MGFKYAGTGNREVKDLILKHIDIFRKELKTVPSVAGAGGQLQQNINQETKNQIDRSTVESCLCVLAYSLGMVMAGTCDVDSFRRLRVLRKRFEAEMHYGYNMAINMSIGFLFLGNGAYTFNRSDKAIASLLCALYPVFPNSPSDNRHHLQALRHFYVMAIETRLLQARDIDTGNFVNIVAVVRV